MGSRCSGISRWFNSRINEAMASIVGLQLSPRRVITLLGAALCGMLLVGASGRAQDAKTAVLVRVVDTVFAQPVPGAIVTLSTAGQPAPQRQRADAQGRVVFVGQAPGTYRVSAAAPFHQPSDTTEFVVRTAAAQELTLRVSPQSSVSGRVVDSTGAPVAGMGVYAVQLIERRDELQSPGPRWHVQTDDLGRYTLSGLPPGALEIRVLTSVLGEQQGRTVRRSATSAGTEIRVLDVGQQHVDVDLTVNVGFLASFSGRVSIPAHPTLTCSLQLLPSDRDLTARDVVFPGEVPHAACDDAGTFQFDVASPGQYRLRGEVRTGGSAGAFWWIDEPVEVVDEPGAPFVVTPLPGLTVSGRLLGLATRVRIIARGEPVSRAGVAGVSRTAEVAEDGTFLLRDLVPGRYRIEVVAPRSHTVGWFIEQGVRRPAGPRDISQSVADFAVLMTERSATVTGHVVRPASRVDVVLFPDAETGWADASSDARRFRRVGIRTDDTFEFEDVPAGRYRILTVPRTWEVFAWATQASLRMMSTQADSLLVPDAGSVFIQLRTGGGLR